MAAYSPSITPIMFIVPIAIPRVNLVPVVACPKDEIYIPILPIPAKAFGFTKDFQLIKLMQIITLHKHCINNKFIGALK